MARIEARERAIAAAEIRAVYARIPDELIAKWIHLFRCGRDEESMAILNTFGITEADYLRAVGHDYYDLDELNERYSAIHRDLLSEPRRSRINAEIKKLQMKGE